MILPSGINTGPHRRRTYPAPQVEAPAFNPGDHRIPDVVEYAESLDPDALAALIDQEREGSNRSTLLRSLEALQDAADDDLTDDDGEA